MNEHVRQLAETLRRSFVPLDGVARVVTALGGAFVVVRALVASLQVCSAGTNCPPVVTSETAVSVLFGVTLLYVAARFDPQ
ncbi:hypothetical protein [Halobaculum sp. MBLA0143]|uniref:hypothetical protein n=1 Tax=Halobaculum sp. MBLA0143 TaxID=3079933 RepID=UPI0035232F8C